MKILLAGGSGLIGAAMEKYWLERGYEVYNLSRSPKGKNHFYWDIASRKIDCPILNEIDVVINLTGESLTNKRWSDQQKIKLHNSRIDSTNFLFELSSQMTNLKHYISASGITCFGFHEENIPFKESDDYGTDYLSLLVKDWEKAANQFERICNTSVIRIGVVLAKEGGALLKMLPAVKLGIGSPIGSGKQIMPWIHLNDLVRMFDFILSKQLVGIFHGISACDSNQKVMKTIAQRLNKPFFMPAVPAFLLKLLYGEMAILLLEGLQVSNDKIKESGFQFEYDTLEKAIDVCLD
jgi:uncharacterized protein